MKELFDASFSLANALPTFLLVLVLVYWLIVLFGMLEFDTLDIDVEVDMDADMDGSPEGGLSWMNWILHFLNLGRVPLMIWLSFVAIPLWIASITINGLFGNVGIIGLILFIPLFLGSAFLAKFLTWPFAKLFDKLDEDIKEVTPIGKVCTVTLNASHTQSGQAEINNNGSFITIYVRTPEASPLAKGATALVIEHNRNEDFYLIEPYETI